MAPRILGDWLITAAVILAFVWFPLAIMIFTGIGWVLRRLRKLVRRSDEWDF